MAYTYTTRHKAPTEQPRQAKAAQPAFAAPAHTPSAAEANLRPVNLPAAIQAKMEASLGADLSAVKLYESEAVAEHGAQAVAQGNRIAFAPGMLDFASTKGQALLGHELSHVVSQARGEARGGGFLNDAALEPRAEKKTPAKARTRASKGWPTIICPPWKRPICAGPAPVWCG